ncbi:sentan-like [Sardina pilchardus]|uniref:sentan-like n=1 Tax=Sardina pilchardus TaxID=27697 RepID=UPI002E108939
MAALVLVFYSSAGPDGRVSREAVKEIFLTQFQAFTRGQESKASYKEVMRELESHGEGTMALEDFLLLTLSLSVTSDLLDAIQEAAGQRHR